MGMLETSCKSVWDANRPTPAKIWKLKTFKTKTPITLRHSSKFKGKFILPLAAFSFDLLSYTLQKNQLFSYFKSLLPVKLYAQHFINNWKSAIENILFSNQGFLFQKSDAKNRIDRKEKNLQLIQRYILPQNQFYTLWSLERPTASMGAWIQPFCFKFWTFQVPSRK